MLAPLLVAFVLHGPPPSLGERRTELAKEALNVAGRVERAIERGDTALILSLVPKEGLSCGDRLIPKAHVARDLTSEGTWLHRTLFGDQGAAASSSLRAFFQGAKEVVVLVGFREDPRQEAGMPCFEYESREKKAPGAPFCLLKRDGKWWLSDCLYPC